MVTIWSDHVLPWGVVRHTDGRVRPATAVGDDVVDLTGLAGAGLLDGALPDPGDLLDQPSLDRFLAAGPDAWRGLRARLRELLDDPDGADRVAAHRVPSHTVTPVMAFTVADYVDFYSSEHHASNVSQILRPDDSALPPAWHHLPIGYHGRAGTVVVSGTEVVRPAGLRADPDDPSRPAHGPSRHLDVEVEVGWIVGVPTELGTTVSTRAFADHVVGCVLVNDWSARDLQAFEYRPLGPFLGKSFATSMSAWIVPLDALDHARIAPPLQDPPPVGHLAPAGDGFNLALELAIVAGDGPSATVSRPPFAAMGWTPAQQLAHLTSNGASLRTGDLFASGTVSGPDPAQRGCLLELTWGWSQPLHLADGSARTDGLADGDTVVIRGDAPGPDGTRTPLGEVVGRVAPTR